MADDDRLRSYRSNDPHRLAPGASRLDERANPGDPLAELARLIGHHEPLASARTGSRPQQQHEAHAAPVVEQEDWPYASDERQHGAYDAREPEHFAPSLGFPPAHEARADARHASSHYHTDQYEDARYTADPRQTGRQQHVADHYLEDEVPLAPHEDAMYDDAPRAHRRGGLATALALIGCAMLGTAGAYGYRSYYTHSAPAQPPPVITADTSTPTKIVPVPAGDAQSGKAVQDRLAVAGKEQLVSTQEEPVALKELGTQSVPRVILPAPVAPAQPSSAPQPSATGSTGLPAPGANEPKRIRTVTIRPDGSDVSGRPVGTGQPAGVTSRQLTPPAPRATSPARTGNGPISPEAQSAPNDPATAARPRVAALPPPSRIVPEPAASGEVLVQLSSQRSENDARASFRSLQAKFPDELGDRQPIIRRADLGAKGVYYRAMVGPFASAQDAIKFCASYKSAGGQCVVPHN